MLSSSKHSSLLVVSVNCTVNFFNISRQALSFTNILGNSLNLNVGSSFYKKYFYKIFLKYFIKQSQICKKASSTSQFNNELPYCICSTHITQLAKAYIPPTNIRSGETQAYYLKVEIKPFCTQICPSRSLPNREKWASNYVSFYLTHKY